jgi:acyl-CoA synthetase (NDP forming)
MESLPARLIAGEADVGAAASDSRLAPRRPDLQPLLAPRSIAFVGASARPNTPGHDMLRMIRRGGFGGTAYAINPRGGGEIEGYPRLPRVADLPSAPDLVVLSVRNERLEEVFRDAVAVGARSAVILASGHLAGEPPPSLSERLAEWARNAGMPVCGPNCMGFYNDLDRVWVCGSPSPREPKPGAIALVAHSGSVFGALAHNDPRLRFALAVSPGQELTATVADYVSYAVERPEVRVVGLFIETARDPQAFAQALEKAAQSGVPVVALKVGRTEAAAAAALTHTGATAGSDLAYEALFDRYGVVRVETLDELAATLLLFATGRRAARGGLVSIHDSGGERELIIDLADRAGVPFAPIGPRTKAAVAAHLDPGLAAENPLDAWGTGADFTSRFEACFQALVDDGNTALGLFCADIRDHYYVSEGFAEAALAVAVRTDKPVALATNYTQVRHDALALRLTEAGVPVLDGTLNALVAVRGALAYRDFQARPEDPVLRPPASRTADRADARQRLGARVLPESESLALLAAWDIPVVPHRIAASAEAALGAARAVGWPVVLKTAAPGVLHKSDAAGVHLGIKDETVLRAAYADVAARLGPDVLVARMIPRGVELALGMVRDPQFGPVITVGAGGVLAELLSDRQSALAPFGPATAGRLIDQLKLRHLLDGYRSGPRVDLEALARAVALFSTLAAELGDVVAEIDVNPLVCGPEIVAVDALVVT